MTAPPLLLAGHGSADPAGADAFVALRERVAATFAGQGVDVAGGFIELSDPPLSAAVDTLVARGHRRAVAVPVVLAAAGHAKGDVPAALAAARERHPGLSFAYGRPLGPHPVLLRLLADRISETVGRRHPHAPTTAADVHDLQDVAVLVVGRGSTDPDANAETYKTSRLLWETYQAGQQRFALAETAFVSLARPDVTEGLERCRRLGARRVVVARYFLFPGVLPDRVLEQASGYAAAREELDVRCTDVLGDCDEIAQLVAARYAEVLTGDIRMNCDMCVYRAELPGFEHRVGAPQRPHYHPAEAPGAANQAHAH
ncbi:MAG TPA: sirohydrochlorin chelatase [Streptosporangiaceae bacterium]|nr:sirohydrochlorin chelatase [Streptosporangiaceae bacterium]